MMQCYIRPFEEIWHHCRCCHPGFWLNSLKFDLNSVCVFFISSCFSSLSLSLAAIHLSVFSISASSPLFVCAYAMETHTVLTFNIVFRYLSYGYAASQIGQLTVSQATFAYV